jgi:hypothetical protein
MTSDRHRQRVNIMNVSSIGQRSLVQRERLRRIARGGEPRRVAHRIEDATVMCHREIRMETVNRSLGQSGPTAVLAGGDERLGAKL